MWALQVSGEVTKLYVEVGDTVKKAMLLPQIDPVTLQNTFNHAAGYLTAKQSKFRKYQVRLSDQTSRACYSASRLER